MDIGIDSFAATVTDPTTGQTLSGADRLNHLIEEIERADAAGLDTFGIGEHHRREYLDAAPAVILAAAAARTTRIRLNSAVTVLSADDPVRVFQQYATLDLLSRGRAEMIVGRGSFAEAYPLFGLDLHHYDVLFAEKLDLLLKLRADTHVHWQGTFRAPLTGQGVYPRPQQAQLPIWIGVGGTPASFARAGTLGLPLMVAIIGGDFRRFRPLVDLYRQAGAAAGHPAQTLRVGVHAFGFVAPTAQAARDAFYPGYARMLDTIGRERGWAPPSRARFDAECGPAGAYLIGGVQDVADKVLHLNAVLGGVDRLTFQMTNVLMPHGRMLRAIDLLGQEVAPLVRARLAQNHAAGVQPPFA
ncbi:LLM class flavin-dependent oxidoreductase (plasmid) [Deinococcus taeanensis]|uniref:Atu2307/SP_0267 family LLM class monooxygenase n=1 Tax=Deinococcus taeanensis TaxID=2737050 RepID=UPI001CDC3E58|nr:Atu2307/SP_0267 family LLM class monooxygenase [Deinococcus taeanensis]UBV44201.1 LLM class flavin-dependent oxidoreductase [Deinococcus taeanensis]